MSERTLGDLGEARISRQPLILPFSFLPSEMLGHEHHPPNPSRCVVVSGVPACGGNANVGHQGAGGVPRPRISQRRLTRRTSRPFSSPSPKGTFGYGHQLHSPSGSERGCGLQGPLARSFPQLTEP